MNNKTVKPFHVCSSRYAVPRKSISEWTSERMNERTYKYTIHYPSSFVVYDVSGLAFILFQNDCFVAIEWSLEPCINQE